MKISGYGELDGSQVIENRQVVLRVSYIGRVGERRYSRKRKETIWVKTIWPKRRIDRVTHCVAAT